MPRTFTETSPLPFIEPSFWLALAVGILFAFPIKPLIEKLLRQAEERIPGSRFPLILISDMVLFSIFVLAIGFMTAEKFLPGIYRRF